MPGTHLEFVDGSGVLRADGRELRVECYRLLILGGAQGLQLGGVETERLFAVVGPAAQSRR